MGSGASAVLQCGASQRLRTSNNCCTQATSQRRCPPHSPQAAARTSCVALTPCSHECRSAPADCFCLMPVRRALPPPVSARTQL